MGEARKNEGVRILYLAALADALERGVAVYPLGRSLVRHLASVVYGRQDVSRVGHVWLPEC